MHTLLIAEDEKLIRAGIRAMVERSGVPVDHIYEANNGQKALEILKSSDIDALFTDIRMPVMDGIELVKEANKLQNPPLMVAISGFDDFSYAVEMLRNGVQEYLLKPLEREKVKEVLTKLDIKLEIVNREHRAREYQKIVSGDYRLVMTMLHPDMVGCSDFVILPDAEDGSVFITEEDSLDELIEDEIVEETIGVSALHHGESEIKAAYREVIEARKRAFCLEKVVRYDDKPDKVPESLKQSAAEGLSANAVTARIQLIGAGTEKDLSYSWHRFFESARRGYTDPSAFFDCMIKTFSEMKRIYRNAFDDNILERIEKAEHPGTFSGLSDYEEFIMETLMLLHQILLNENEEPTQRKIHEAVAYIQEHYSEDLNMAVVSNYISMNYSLFSLAFKQNTGENFVSYLKKLRLNKARKLLEETDEKIIDISHEVGYDNEKHFSKLFKSEFGVSPVDYRKSLKQSSA
ncbi:MAG: response regulator [Candidatus Weimeria sp.]